MFVRAAEGLDAAHRLGVVHRDFKPDNVMVELGARGQVTRVRVMDFGLAVSTEDADSIPSSPSGSGDVVLQSDRLTQTGAVVGTPMYLAPEQEAGAAGTPLTDQFAFCVALFEGLYGVRPFSADSHKELSRKKWSGQFASRPEGTPVPAALHAVVLRGLSALPPERWPTMPALVEAMESACVATPRPRWIAPVVLASAGGLAAAGWIATSAPACDDPTALMDAVWSADHREAVRASFVGTELPFAADSADGAVEALDRYAARWVEAWPSGCAVEAATVQQACLRDRLSELSAMALRLGSADEDTVRRALEVTRGLSDPGTCAFESVPAVASSERAAHARALLQQANVAKSVGEVEDAKALATDAGRAAAEAGDCESTAGVLQLQAELAADARGPAAGIEYSEAAYFEAVGCEATSIALEAARYTMSLHTWGTGDLEAAQLWHGHAVAQLDKLGPGPDGQPDVDRAVVLYTHAHLLQRQGDREATLAALEQADALLRPHADAFPGAMSELLAARGAASLVFEGPQAGLPFYEEGLALAENEFGEFHPMVAIGYGNLGNNYQFSGRLEDSERALRRAAALMPKAFGPEHPYVVRSHNGLAQVLTLSNRWDEARAQIEQGMQLAERIEPEGGPETWRLLKTRAAVASFEDDLESARVDMQRVVDAAESQGNFDGEMLWDVMKLAEYQIGLGRLDEAEYRLSQASQHLRTRLQGEEVLGGKVEATWALLHAARGDHVKALESFDEAEAAISGVLGRQSLEWAEIREAHADLLLEMKRTDEARSMFQTLAGIYDAVEMPEDAQRLRERVTQL